MDHLDDRHDFLAVDGRRLRIHRVDRVPDSDHLPVTVRILIEQSLRHGEVDQARALTAQPAGSAASELSFRPSRLLLQDSSGTPALIDLVAMRDGLHAAGKDPSLADASLPVDLVVDHALVADHSGHRDAVERNTRLEYERNRERYEFLRWCEGAIPRLRIVPPGRGIVHQVNLEHLTGVVWADGGAVWPDTVLGTDSHTTMVNALGVLGWGIGGIEAVAVMVGQPVAVPRPVVVGVELRNALPPGTTATDLVLALTALLRREDVRGCFLEFHGEGCGSLPLEARATVSNMAPEFGCISALFAVDDRTLRYLRLTGRTDEQLRLVEAYCKEQGLFHTDEPSRRYDRAVTVDLAGIEPSLAGPVSPSQLVPLSAVPASFAVARARDDRLAGEPAAVGGPERTATTRNHELRDGAVVIAAITSCANTSNPAVMLAAGLLARNAARRGLRTRSWVKTSLAPGSRTVMAYLAEAGLTADLETLGFHVIGFGCTTCAGRSGPLEPGVSEAIIGTGLGAVAVLSGNRNFEGRIHPDCRFSYLASPPLVIAYALAGRIDVDLTAEPLGTAVDGTPVYLADLWPASDEIERLVHRHVRRDMYRAQATSLFAEDAAWSSLHVSGEGHRFPWDPQSLRIRRPPFAAMGRVATRPFDGMTGARPLLVLDDDVTTDHISPTGAIAATSDAGVHLIRRGEHPAGLGTFSSRRGNHEVMVRGTFTNPRLQNRLAPRHPGGMTRHLPSNEVVGVFAASERYRADGVSLVILAGERYGTGSSRDWAAKGTALLGVRAVLAGSFERIHRANLVGVGVLPLQLPARPDRLGLRGDEQFDLAPLAGADDRLTCRVTVRAEDGTVTSQFDAVALIQSSVEWQHLRHGGVLPFVSSTLGVDGSAEANALLPPGVE